MKQLVRMPLQKCEPRQIYKEMTCYGVLIFFVLNTLFLRYII